MPSTADAQIPETCPRTPCFIAGVRIATLRGEVEIENLRPGDRVLTRDNGYRPLRWIGARHFDADALERFAELRPVTIRRGSLGPDMPSRDLTVSPQHRILMSGEAARLLGAESEVLVAACDLHPAQRVPEVHTEVTYFHLMFDAHEVILADGAWSESFRPDRAALDGLHTAQLWEILAIFPELATEAGLAAYVPARAGWSRPGDKRIALAA
ncbi:Hint domain-containing protein [Defluviimonas sp. WL0024]|uniref:Hint domain-containing protein n=1 Tax=Albidovulum salinarum TaxID=2984153 RepID=A0ABT2WYQ5_9RHOB|nr:Hint domain-containing protein [Defluviimonas sp. WL0024]MCU9846810.1 Hint domain-containing protein [Defluviimonas sp. WL0024]